MPLNRDESCLSLSEFDPPSPMNCFYVRPIVEAEYEEEAERETEKALKVCYKICIPRIVEEKHKLMDRKYFTFRRSFCPV